MSKTLIVCEGGPLDERWVDARLGDEWPAAVWVNYGSHSSLEAPAVPRYDHIIGTYRLHVPSQGQRRYIWQGLDQHPVL